MKKPCKGFKKRRVDAVKAGRSQGIEKTKLVKVE